jgi:hypothetical protein
MLLFSLAGILIVIAILGLFSFMVKSFTPLIVGVIFGFAVFLLIGHTLFPITSSTEKSLARDNVKMKTTTPTGTTSLASDSNLTVEDTMKSDLSKAIVGVTTVILNHWKGKPLYETPITFNASEWSITDQGKIIASGTASPGNLITGTIWINGSYCIQTINSATPAIWSIRSDNLNMVAQACPTDTQGISPVSPIPSIK